jgi:hypothetical protein
VKAPELPIARWLSGKPMTFASLRGRVVLLGFWMCYQTNNDRLFERLVDLDRRYRSRGLATVSVVLLSWDETYMRKLLSAARPTYPVGLYDSRIGANQPRSSPLTKFTEAAGLSDLYVVDRKGFARSVSDYSKVEVEIEKALAR